MEDIRNVLLCELKAKFVNRIRLPETIGFSQEGTAVRMTLEPRYVGVGEKPQNMQTDGAAFEAWALILHEHLGRENVVLDVAWNDTERPDMDLFRKKRCGHYARFLYRAYKFSQQFSGWFSCSKELETRIRAFADYLYQPGRRFVNNVPTDGAKEYKDDKKTEYQVEVALAGAKEAYLRELAEKQSGLILQSGSVQRQLPVGLFEETVSRETSIFTGEKSAIDLWAPAGDDIAIFELKTNNAKVGIVSELMFYANYMYDFFVAETTFVPSPQQEPCRGYHHLVEKSYSGIKAYLLTDGLHPLITDEIVAAMNDNAVGITYGKLEYDGEKI